MRIILYSFICITSFVKGFFPKQKYYMSGMYNDQKYPLSRPHYEKYFNIKNKIDNCENTKELRDFFLNRKKYPFSKNYYENSIKRLNSKNITEQNNEILGNDYFNKKIALFA